MKVVFSNPIPGGQEQRLIDAGYDVVVLTEESSIDQFIAQAEDADAIVSLLSDQINKEFLGRMSSKLRLIANYAVGYNNISVSECNEIGVAVTNTPDVLTDATADTAMLLILMCLRRIPESEKLLRKGLFKGWKPDLLLGRDLKGKNLGIIGMGRIGEALAKRAEAFGMNVLYYTRSGVKNHLPYPSVQLETILRESDVISLHCPLNNETRHLIGEKEFEKMKPEAVLINTARGPVIDEKAFAKALKDEKIFYGGCDVFEDEPLVNKELLECSNAVLLPHIGSGTIETRTEMAKLVVNSVLEAFEGKVPTLTVNPEFVQNKAW